MITQGHRHSDFFFVLMSDPQFGMFAAFSGLGDETVEGFRRRGLNVGKSPKVAGVDRETKLYERAIARTNELKPSFVVVCGDMVHDADDLTQLRELQRISDKLSDQIPIYWVAGNRDVGTTPTRESLQRYRGRFGKDYYSFDHGGSRFIVLNSSVILDPSSVPREWERQLDFLMADLEDARGKGCAHVVVFAHHPLFLKWIGRIPLRSDLTLVCRLLLSHGGWSVHVVIGWHR